MTAAIKRPVSVTEISKEFGAQCCVVAIDTRRVDGSDDAFEVYTHAKRVLAANNVTVRPPN